MNIREIVKSIIQESIGIVEASQTAPYYMVKDFSDDKRSEVVGIFHLETDANDYAKRLTDIAKQDPHILFPDTLYRVAPCYDSAFLKTVRSVNPDLFNPHLKNQVDEDVSDDNVSRRRHIKVTYEDGNTIETPINGTRQEITDYYVGKYFNMGSGEEDKMVMAVNVDFLD